MVLNRGGLPAADVHALLSNRRRRLAVRRLAAADAVDVGDLARAIAEAEAGESPPPSAVRESVYASLHQTHLPKLDEAGVVDYDADRKRVRARQEARYVHRQLHLRGPAGLPWDDHYRALATVGLCGVVAAAVELPVASTLPPLAWATLALAAVAVTTCYQLWQLRTAGMPSGVEP